MPTETLVVMLINQNSLLNSILINTEVHDYNFLVSASTSLQPIILSEVGDKKLTTIFLETALILEGSTINHVLPSLSIVVRFRNPVTPVLKYIKRRP